jgi:geranylgeranyl pyrophosphate synthase
VRTDCADEERIKVRGFEDRDAMKGTKTTVRAGVEADWRTDADALRGRLDAWGRAFEESLGRYLVRVCGEGVENLHDAMAYALGSDIEDPALRGKRIRPALCLLTAEALGATAARAMPFALAIELMHNFALVHDDIQDGDVMRRGRASAWVKFGVPHAINIGDYLLVHATRVLTDWPVDEAKGGLDAATRLRLVKLIGSALDHTHIGQALEINYRGTKHFSEEEYLRIVREKTGHYLAAPIQGGAIVAGTPDDVLEHIGAMAQFLGPMFQIIDDIIDLTDGKGREAIGSDLREGKRSFLVAHVCERGTAAERERLLAILDKPREATGEEDIREAVELFGRHGAIEAGREYCRRLHEGAKRELEALPAALAGPLGMVLEMLVERKK